MSDQDEAATEVKRHVTQIAALAARLSLPRNPDDNQILLSELAVLRKTVDVTVRAICERQVEQCVREAVASDNPVIALQRLKSILHILR